MNSLFIYFLEVIHNCQHTFHHHSLQNITSKASVNRGDFKQNYKCISTTKILQTYSFLLNFHRWTFLSDYNSFRYSRWLIFGTSGWNINCKIHFVELLFKATNKHFTCNKLHEYILFTLYFIKMAMSSLVCQWILFTRYFTDGWDVSGLTYYSSSNLMLQYFDIFHHSFRPQHHQLVYHLDDLPCFNFVFHQRLS